MIKDLMPFVAGSYGATVIVLGTFALLTLLRYRTARRLLAAAQASRGKRR